MQVREAVQKASQYLPDVFETATGRELRLEGVEKSDNSRFWKVTFSYTLGDQGFDSISREYKTVKVRDANGELMGAQNEVPHDYAYADWMLAQRGTVSTDLDLEL